MLFAYNAPHCFPVIRIFFSYSPHIFLPMQYFKLLSALLLSSPALFAQNTDTTKQKDHLALYRRALEYNDLGSAAYSLTNYLYWGGDEKYSDTLALVYYGMNNLGGAYKLAGEINGKDPKNVTALTLLADVSGRAGEIKKSLEWYEKLIEISPTAYNHYQLATKQFVLERNMECKQSLQKVIADSTAAMEQKVRLDIGEVYGEDVPVLAAALNMMGAIAFKEKDTAGAINWYSRAISAYPQFVIAKQNLDDLKKGSTPAKPATPSKPPVKKG